MSVPDGDEARSFRDIVRFPLHRAVAFGSVTRFAELTGLWTYPAPATGDLEEMRFLDKAYWLYKTDHPIRRAVRGSAMEAFFALQSWPGWTAPEGFRATGALSVSAVGDLMNHAYLDRSAKSLYAQVAEILFGADVAMGNLECVVLDPPPAAALRTDLKAAPLLSFNRDTFRTVTTHAGRQYAFLAAACNHSLDFGEAGVQSTINALRGQGIPFHGVNATEEDAECAAIIEKNGVKLGVVSHCFGLNAHRPPAGRPRIVNRTRLNDRPERVDFSLLEAQLRHARQAQADFVVAQLHWGMEHEFYPRPEQRLVAHHLAEMGVDAIVGHHPHVLQPVEYYRTRRDGARVVPIYYSLGNLTNPCSASYLCRSGLARIELVKGTTEGGASRTYVRRADVAPIDQIVDRPRRLISLRPVNDEPAGT